MKTSAKGIALLKRFEGCELKAYQDGEGVWTIGYGHTAMAGGLAPKLGVVITQAQADDMLAVDIRQYEYAVEKATRLPKTQNQFDAMVSLCYNIGAKGFTKSSVVRFFNAGGINEAADAFLLWNKDEGETVKGLINRRAAERALFLTANAPVAAPSPVPVPDLPDIVPDHPDAPVETEKPSLQNVMVFVGIIIAAIAAYFGFGG